jgi:gamma-glutamylcyclotransferase (GGCT)/AIG2-like uncharacterized protein YtfP
LASITLFVYGSLKRGAVHHAQLRGAQFLGEARTAPGHRVELLGGYLALIKDASDPGCVSGELFEIDEALLVELDAFEGDAYERRAVVLEPAAAATASESAAAYFKR